VVVTSSLSEPGHELKSSSSSDPSWEEEEEE
jgi:hypothetical protein